MSFTKATRQNVPLLIGLAGPSGSGKTYSALRLARGLAGDAPIAAIDTERGRMLHYADHFDFLHDELEAPFAPKRYGEKIGEALALNPGVVIVDSFSHEWAGEGGVLDMQQAEFERMGSRDAVKVASWIKPKDEHKRLLNHVLLRLPCHLILCLRAEDKIEIVKDDKGKTQVVPKKTLAGHEGWIPVTGKEVPYELTVSLVVTPDNPGVPRPIKLEEHHRELVFTDVPLDEATGERLAAWAKGSVATPSAADSSGASDTPLGVAHPAPAPTGAPETITQEQAEALKALAKAEGAPLADLLKGYEVERLRDLTVAQYAELTAFLTKEPAGAAA